MREYDPSEPLIFIHVPKCGGMTSKNIFKSWYQERLLQHYFDEETGQMPKRHDLSCRHSAEKPLVLYGHFNKLRNFGVQDYYPEAKQFMTVLRDPFEMTLSHYFYVRKVGSSWKDQSRIPDKDIVSYMAKTKPNMLNHFPRETTKHNYKEIIDEYFIIIGITEHLNESMRRIAKILSQPYDDSILGFDNATERDQELPTDLRAMFMDKNQLEFDVYHYALAEFNRNNRA